MGKQFVIVQLLFAIVFMCFDLGVTQAGDQPPATSLEPAMVKAVTQEMSRYTTEEFDALNDADKRDVYLHQPQRLPDNFSPLQYPLLMQAE